MSQSVAGSRPEWVSDTLYPFQSRYFAAPNGRMHYLDEGSGAPIVFVHGNPSWSFEFRHLVGRAQGPVPLRGARPPGVRPIGDAATGPRTIIRPPMPRTSPH